MTPLRGGPFQIQRQQPRQGFIIAEVGPPTIRREDRRIQFAMRVLSIQRAAIYRRKIAG